MVSISCTMKIGCIFETARCIEELEKIEFISSKIAKMTWHNEKEVEMP